MTDRLLELSIYDEPADWMRPGVEALIHIDQAGFDRTLAATITTVGLGHIRVTITIDDIRVTGPYTDDGWIIHSQGSATFPPTKETP